MDVYKKVCLLFVVVDSSKAVRYAFSHVLE